MNPFDAMVDQLGGKRTAQTPKPARKTQTGKPRAPMLAEHRDDWTPDLATESHLAPGWEPQRDPLVAALFGDAS